MIDRIRMRNEAEIKRVKIYIDIFIYVCVCNILVFFLEVPVMASSLSSVSVDLIHEFRCRD